MLRNEIKKLYPILKEDRQSFFYSRGAILRGRK